MIESLLWQVSGAVFNYELSISGRYDVTFRILPITANEGVELREGLKLSIAVLV
jgi:hypothetical protein